VAENKPISITVGGTFNAMYSYVSQDDGTSEVMGERRSHGMIREAEIRFGGQTRLDNGLLIGVRVNLEAEDCNDQIDESWIFFDSQWGRVEIGETDLVGWKMYYGAPNAIPNFSTSVNNIVDWNGIGPYSATSQNWLNPFARLNLGNDTNHISYFTPRFAGFQIGASYSPENLKGGDATGYGTAVPGNAPASTTVPGSVPLERQGGSSGGMICDGASCASNSVQDIFEIAANYVNKFGDVSVAAFGSYGRGDTQNPGVGREDRTEWGLGAQLGYAGFSVGGAYRRDDRGISSNGDQTDWNVGVGYATGPWAFSLGYGAASQEQTAGGEDKFALVELAARYNLGPGIELAAAIQRFDIEDSAGAAANENAGWAVAVGTALKF
jgi:predicted porin